MFELERVFVEKNMRMEYHGTMLPLMLASVINQQDNEYGRISCNNVMSHSDLYQLSAS